MPMVKICPTCGFDAEFARAVANFNANGARKILDENAELRRQRDELLAACREMVDLFQGLCETRGENEAIGEAKAAIANAEGKA